MLKFVSLSSGSNGNSYYIGDQENGILIDAGIGGRSIKKRLSQVGIGVESIRLILVTHDHIDHIKHLGSIADRLSLPVFSTSGLKAALSNHSCTREHISQYIREIEMFKTYSFFGFNFTPFPVPHDATETVGYRIEYGGNSIVFLTDVGSVNDTILRYCNECNHIIVESNYDMDMLMTGSYPADLKHRIIGGNGHLSNEQCASLLRRIYHKDLRSIFLCHLSENNNTPELALIEISKTLEELERGGGESITLKCLPRRSHSDLFSLY